MNYGKFKQFKLFSNLFIVFYKQEVNIFLIYILFVLAFKLRVIVWISLYKNLGVNLNLIIIIIIIVNVFNIRSSPTYRYADSGETVTLIGGE